MTRHRSRPLKALLVLVLLTVPLGAAAEEGHPWYWETAWAARQLWGPQTQSSGIVTWLSASGFFDPGVMVALGAGLDVGVGATGSFAGMVPSVLARAGMQLPWAGAILFEPWTGAAMGWPLGPGSPGLPLSGEVGLDTEMRLWDRQYGVLGLGWRTDGAWEVSFGFRDRSAFRLPPPPIRPRLVPGGQVIRSISLGPAPLLPRPVNLLSVVVTSGPFSPDGDGEGDQLQVKVSSYGLKAVRWSWSILAPQGDVFFRQSGEGAVPSEFTWNGVSQKGELVSSATSYTVLVEAEDGQGRPFAGSVDFVTDVLLLKDHDRYLIRLPSINFTANSPGLPLPSSSTPGRGDRIQVTLLDQNAQVLQRLAEILRRFPQYSITIVGHANLIHWDDPVKAAEENRKESQPLSLQRAQAVKDALVALGLDTRRIKAEGAGGSRPLFPFNDMINSWKNRRVDIVLDKTITAR